MLFRRLSQHIKDQNWFAVGIDFLLVVLGVFVGLQVDSWNAARQERVEERGYLTRLHADMTASIEQTRRAIDFQHRQADRAAVVLRDLEICRVSESDQVDFANGLYHLGKVAPTFLAHGTIDELQSTGKLAILRNPALRSQLGEMLIAVDNRISLFAILEGRIQPHINYVDSIVVYGIESPTVGTTELTWEDVDLDIESVCRDRRFYTAVAAVRNYTYDLVTWNRETIAHFERVRKLIGDELGLVSKE